MVTVLETAKAQLRSRGLHAEEYGANSLNVWATELPARDGIKLSHDMSRLYSDGSRLTVQFPGPGQCRFAISGDPAEILDLIGAVYALYLERGGTVANVVTELVPDAERHVIGRPA